MDENKNSKEEEMKMKPAKYGVLIVLLGLSGLGFLVFQVGMVHGWNVVTKDYIPFPIFLLLCSISIIGYCIWFYYDFIYKR